MKKQNYLDFVQSILSSDEDFLLFKEFYQKRLPKSIKFVQYRGEIDNIKSFLISQGWEFSLPEFLSHSEVLLNDVEYVDSYDVKSLGSHFFHSAGLFYIQEISAGLSAQVLDVKKGDLVLDLCSAPGGKTVQLADRLLSLGGGHVFANELSFARRKALIFNLNRCGLYNTSILGYDGVDIGSLAPEMFDKVLVDAPCSGEGMQYKYDKNVVYWDQVAAEKLSKIQKELLMSGLRALKVGGELVYSTCTMNPFENEGVVSYVLDQFQNEVVLIDVSIPGKSFGLENYLDSENSRLVARFWPYIQKTGGFFIAKFKKLKSLNVEIQEDKRFLKKSEYDESDALRNNVWDYLNDEWGIKKVEEYQFFASHEFIYVKDSGEFNNKGLFVEKQGIPIIKLGFKGDYIPQQGLVSVFGNMIHKNVVELDYLNLQKISGGADIPGDYGFEGKFIVIKWNSLGLFLAKQVKNFLKLKI